MDPNSLLPVSDQSQSTTDVTPTPTVNPTITPIVIPTSTITVTPPTTPTTIVTSPTIATTTLTGIYADVLNIFLPDVIEMIGSRTFDISMVYTMISTLITDIENISQQQTAAPTGAVKQQIALTVFDDVINQLVTMGKLNSQTAQMITDGINVLGPAIIDFASTVVKSIEKEVSVVDNDIETGKCCWSKSTTTTPSTVSAKPKSKSKSKSKKSFKK